MYILFLIFLIFTSCGPSSLEDYKELGKSKTRKLLTELQKIHNRDQLLDAESAITQCFKEIADTMIAAEKFHKNEMLELSFQDHELSDQLRFELIRIYRFDGGKEILERVRNNSINHVIPNRKNNCINSSELLARF